MDGGFRSQPMNFGETKGCSAFHHPAPVISDGVSEIN